LIAAGTEWEKMGGVVDASATLRTAHQASSTGIEKSAKVQFRATIGRSRHEG
jgi:hypothetical protein